MSHRCRYKPLKRGTEAYWRNLAGRKWVEGDTAAARRYEELAAAAFARSAMKRRSGGKPYSTSAESRLLRVRG